MDQQVSYEHLDDEGGSSLTDQMRWLHVQVRQHHPQVHRIAIALYDARHGLLKTYVNSSDVTDPLALYERPLSEVPSLSELASRRESRVIHDFTQLPLPHGEHTVWLLARGYRSSYTVPLYQAGTLLGFLFFDSRKPGAFDGRLPDDLQIYVQLCRLSVLNVFNLSHAVEGMVKVARGLAHLRDIETGRHLDRMSSYVRLIAQRVARHYRLDDEFIEHLYLFSPLHDIGKVGISDSILLKPGRLNDSERRLMQGHVELGVKLINEVMQEAGLATTPYLAILRNIVGCHHELLDGSGYPRGLRGDEIPLEARIVSIADVFDALTAERPYKKPWTNAEALAELARMSDRGQLDPHCVSAFASCIGEVGAIQKRFGLSG
ncbi:Metal dependent phosphohydrolase [Methyloversatilis universalis FAM5]|uniref:Metal dependent phosphohydrolase n=1 Tax=Methyloversatilis universalis (strain ATCC BAA-1314 / DSM 25237 / JCM 13912 / CCUG 52030 / FAM5) TaxID=1000565 RepID=F5RGQ3_METUF|nr:HD domain-containing phosphohydrolase [Methyloversatilis universalis]EGK70107.1 Metal dependent phosphohydrolase [Methyloversatilis universalis FAM5]